MSTEKIAGKGSCLSTRPTWYTYCYIKDYFLSSNYIFENVFEIAKKYPNV